MVLVDFNVKIYVQMSVQVSVKSEVRASKGSTGGVLVGRGGGGKKNLIYFVVFDGHLYDYFLHTRTGWGGCMVLYPTQDLPLSTSQ